MSDIIYYTAFCFLRSACCTLLIVFPPLPPHGPANKSAHAHLPPASAHILLLISMACACADLLVVWGPS